MNRVHQGQESGLRESVDHAPRVSNSSVDDIVELYTQLPGQETHRHEQQHVATKELLWGALTTYADDRDKALATPRISKSKLEQIDKKYYTVVEEVQKINNLLPPHLLEELSLEFSNYAINNPANATREVREAAASMGVRIGINNGSVNAAKIDIIATHCFKAIKTIDKVGPDIEQQSRVALTKSMLHELGKAVVSKDTPSVIDTAKIFVEKNNRKVIGAGLTGALALSLSTTGAAAASESTPLSIQMSQEAPDQDNQKPENIVVTPAPDKAPEKAPEKASETPSPDATPAPVVNIDMTVPDEKAPDTPEQPKVDQVVTPPPVIEMTIPTPSEQPDESEKAPETPAPDTAPAPVVNIDMTVPDKPAPKAPDVAPEQPKVDPVVPIDMTIPTPSEKPDAAPAPPEKAPDTAPDGKKLTPEQKKDQKVIQEIIDSINKDGLRGKAVALILDTFRNKNAIETKLVDGEAQVTIKNPTLVENIKGLQATYQGMLDAEAAKEAEGHADVNYTNTAFMALAILDAMSQDETVLQSPKLQPLLANIAPPADPYQLKLYANAEKAFDDNAAVLLANVTAGPDGLYHKQIKTMYAYASLASLSDTEQATQIEAIKAEEARLAAEAAAGGNYASSPEAEAFKNLIERETDPARKHAFMFMNIFMNKFGLDAIPSAAIVGNGWGESGMIDLCKGQNGGGPAKNVFQWEGERLTKFELFAASQGKSCKDLDIQADFVESELGRNHTRDAINNAGTLFGAVKEFMVRWETPRKVIDAQKTGNWVLADKEAQRRTNLAQPILDAFNAEVGAVNAARAAAEAARAAAEAERIAKMGMNVEQANAFIHTYGTNPESLNYLGNSILNCNGGARSNCVSLSVYFVNKYTNFGGMQKSGSRATNPGHGKEVADRIIARNPGAQGGSTARPFSVFSMLGGEFGHTGLILGVDEARGVAIVAEAFCTSQTHNGRVKEYPLAKMNNGDYKYAYSDGYLKGPVQ